MTDRIDLDPVRWITASSIGPPGERTFYLQARAQTGEYVALLVEKEQVRALSQLGQELLARVGVTVRPDDTETADMQLVGPVVPLWRAGQMSLGSDEEGEVFVLEAEEFDPDAEDPDQLGTARFAMSREQMIKLTAYAAYVVEAGGRERCQVCDGLKDPVVGCFGCPATNGHGAKRR